MKRFFSRTVSFLCTFGLLTFPAFARQLENVHEYFHRDHHEHHFDRDKHRHHHFGNGYHHKHHNGSGTMTVTVTESFT